VLADIRADVQAAADPVKGAFFPRFFKTCKGQYGEGDIFLGVTVPALRLIAKKHQDASMADIRTLLKDPVHEYRLLALFLLNARFRKGNELEKKAVVDLYLENLDCVNNWDLVDASAPYILGPWLFGKDSTLLDELASSGHLWRQRIAIVSTLFFIRQGKLEDTLRIAETLLHHPHDLIHKAVGWMLREAGKKDQAALERFLRAHGKTMPRTMLRYAIERFPDELRREYMRK
jgi:3-methyladenine DNA glycosylase AlkD